MISNTISKTSKDRPPCSSSRLSGEVRFLQFLCSTTLVVLTLLLLIEEGIRHHHGRTMSTDAWRINLAGRQRTLSQQIAERGLELLAVDRGLIEGNTATSIVSLQKLIKEFQASHEKLTRPNQFDIQVSKSAQIQALYDSLQPDYQRLIDRSQTILRNAGNGSRSMTDQQKIVLDLREAAAQFLPVMDRIVSAYETDLRARMAWNERISGILTTAMVATVIIAFFGLVRPLLRRSMEAAEMTEHALADSKRATRKASQLAAFARHSTNAMIRTDAQRRILWVNEGFSRITGFRPEEALEKVPGDLLQCERTDPEVVRAMRAALDAGQPFRGRILNRSKSGKDYWLDLEIIPEHDENSRVTGFIAVESDVTELVAAKEEAEAARRQADKANRAKSEFVANMSHEIRTPMTAILGYTDIMAREITGEPGQSADAIRTIQTNAKHLLTIINDILDVSKLDAGQLKIESVETNPIQIVEEVSRLSRPDAVQKQIDFQVEYHIPIPERIESDPTRIRQILLNLVSNAIKFTEKGSVCIHVSYGESRQQFIMAVADTGIGMTPQQRDTIAKFAAFQQADMSTARKFGGTGLGLHICSALTRLLGGCLKVDSEYGKGTTFTATITAKAGKNAERWISGQPQIATDGLQAEPGGDASALIQQSVLNGIRILLAEDGPDNQRLISHYLRKAGADVEICENGRQAVQRLTDSTESQPIDLVLMDMQMPELDGYQATSQLRERGIDLPIIALTAHAMAGDRQKCLDAGCNDYVTKPIDPARLLTICGKLAGVPALRCQPVVNDVAVSTLA